MIVSSDGSSAAAVELGTRREIVLIGLASGAAPLRIPIDHPELVDLGGAFPLPRAWRDDGTGIVVRGQPNGHRFFGVASLFLNGAVLDHEISAFGEVVPNGRHFLAYEDEAGAWDIDAVGCDLYETLRVIDLTTGDTTGQAP